MQNATIAAILSAFLFPGSGHLMLKRKAMGWALVGLSLVPTCYLIYSISLTVIKLFTLIEKQILVPDLGVMAGYLWDHPFGDNPEMSYYALGFAILLWLFAIVDAYRIGYQLDERTNKHNS